MTVLAPRDAESEPARRPGRPRSVEADRAILLAAADAFADVGFDALTLEAVAARAGVGKASIYRRYGCKIDLVVAVAEGFIEMQLPPPDTGSTHGDLVASVERLVTMLTTTPLGRALPMLVASRLRVPDLDRALDAIIAAKRACNLVVVERGIARGDIRADADPERVVDTYLGPLFHRLLTTNKPLDAAFVRDVVAVTLRAYGTA